MTMLTTPQPFLSCSLWEQRNHWRRFRIKASWEYPGDVSRCCQSLCVFWRCSWSRPWRKAWVACVRAAGSRCPSASRAARRGEWLSTGPPTPEGKTQHWETGNGAPAVQGIATKPTLVKVLELTCECSEWKCVDGTALGKRFYTWTVMLKSLFPVQNYCYELHHQRNTSAFHWTGRLLGVFTADKEKPFNSLPCPVIFQATFSI